MNKWSDDLKCFWCGWRVTGAKELSLDVPDLNFTDMEGAIRVATILLPNVSTIRVLWGKNVVTAYKRRRKEWTAISFTANDQLQPRTEAGESLPE